MAFLRVRTERGPPLAPWQGGRNPFWFSFEDCLEGGGGGERIDSLRGGKWLSGLFFQQAF